MKDKILVYAIGISVLAHLAVAGIFGQASGLRLHTASIVPVPRPISVDLVSNPDDALKPEPAPEPVRQVQAPLQVPKPVPVYTPSVPVYQPKPAPVAPTPGNTHSVPQPPPRPETVGNSANSGGELNYGSTSSRGDLQGSWKGGRTSVGWVPNNSGGEGRGSGTAAGQGTPEPPKPAANPDMKPAPPPAPAPVPKMVNVRVCSSSGMLSGEHCKQARTASFIDGQQPTRKCTQCRAPEPEPVHQSRLADRANPELARDSKLTIPASVVEGLTVTVEVEYTVTEDGDVTGVKVVKSSGSKALDKAVVSAASGLKYKPAVQNGTPRSVKMNRTYKINT